MKIDILSEANKVLTTEAECILEARKKLGDAFRGAVETIFKRVQSGGKVVVTGVGKSGKVAAKVAATLTSTGTPSLFLHAAEASHGDLGVVMDKDTLLVFSYSGGSDELFKFIPHLRDRKIPIISIVGNFHSRLVQESDFVIDGSVSQEACPLNLAPTSSTTVALSLGDALAVVLLKKFDFKEENFALNHPGGNLGRRLTSTVHQFTATGSKVAWVLEEDSIEKIVDGLTEKKLGGVLVKNKSGKWVGLITDGDIRRALRKKDSFFKLRASDIMTKNPVSIRESEKAIRALELMENRESQISILPVLNDEGECVGLVRLHDLIGQI